MPHKKKLPKNVNCNKSQDPEIIEIHHHSLEDYIKIPFIPEIHLNSAEFSDPIRTIIKLREQYEAFGGVKICPPSNWKPEFSFGIDDRAVTTRKQIIQELTKGKVSFFFFFFFFSLIKEKKIYRLLIKGLKSLTKVSSRPLRIISKRITSTRRRVG